MTELYFDKDIIREFFHLFPVTYENDPKIQELSIESSAFLLNLMNYNAMYCDCWMAFTISGKQFSKKELMKSFCEKFEKRTEFEFIQYFSELYDRKLIFKDEFGIYCLNISFAKPEFIKK